MRCLTDWTRGVLFYPPPPGYHCVALLNPLLPALSLCHPVAPPVCASYTRPLGPVSRHTRTRMPAGSAPHRPPAHSLSHCYTHATRHEQTNRTWLLTETVVLPHDSQRRLPTARSAIGRRSADQSDAEPCSQPADCAQP